MVVLYIWYVTSQISECIYIFHYPTFLSIKTLTFLVFIPIRTYSLIILWCFDNTVLHEMDIILIVVDYIYILIMTFIS